MTDSRRLFEGKYEILAKIRESGAGTSYRVRHRVLHEIRILQVLRPDLVPDSDAERRFLDEANVATRLRHPNVGAIYDFAIDEHGAPCLVLEQVDGFDLADYARLRGLAGVPLALEIAHQTLLALGYLHRKGVVHGEVTPRNLMLATDAEHNPTVKLVGLAVTRRAAYDSDAAASGAALGSPRYASPEQLDALPSGERLDGRSDLYSLGIVLYELLTGQPPFQGESEADVARARDLDRIIPFEKSDLSGRVPPDLRAVVLRALERRRDDRFATADEFDRAIVALQSRYGPRDRFALAAEAVAAAARRDAPQAGASAPFDEGGATNFAARPSEIADPDPLHTIRMASGEPLPPPHAATPPNPSATPPSLGAVELIGADPADRARDARDAKRARDLRGPDMGVPLKQARSRRTVWLVEVLVLGAAVGAAVGVWRSWPSRSARAAEAREAGAPVVSPPEAATPVATAPAEAVSQTAAGAVSSTSSTSSIAPPTAPALEPTTPAIASAPLESAAPTEAAPAPTSAPTAMPTAIPTPSVEPSPSPSAPSPRQELAEASAAAAAARRDAESARGQDFAPTTFARGVAKQATADKLARAGSAREAAARYREARDFFTRAAALGREAGRSR
ncbi:MAG TPA: serine/threonine-protein kinase [Thermoanaerobaculia bacterium]|nr:serine/threonine-protein kinase [Thermoanaerobaculia bacterium]